MSVLPLRPLGFGEIVDGAVQLYRRDFVLYYLIALVAALPGFLLTLFAAPDLAAIANLPDDPFSMAEEAGDLLATLAVAGLVAVVTLVCGWFGSVALTVAIRERAGEREVGLGEAWRSALPYFPAALGAGGLALLGFMGVGIVSFVLFGAVMAALIAAGSTGVALVGAISMLGVALLLATIWMGVTFGIFPALVFEGRGAVRALGRSISLCRGGVLRVIGVVVVVSIIQLAPSFGVQMLFGFDNFFANPEAMGDVGATEQWLSNTVDFIVGSLTLPFAVGAMVVLFHDRRVRREGFDLAVRAEALRPDGPTGR